MQSLIESVSEVLTESTVDGSGKKVHRINGPFLMFDKPNQNKRKYPEKIMDAAVENYVKNYVKTSRALGELNHPEKRLSIDPERACIITESLEKDGKYYIGTARVLTTPLGRLLSNLLDDKVRIGVSSRGAGNVKKQGDYTIVEEGFTLKTAADVVYDPSVADAFVECIMEDKEYVRYGDILVEKDLYEARDVVRRATMNDLEKAKLTAFEMVLDRIGKQHQ